MLDIETIKDIHKRTVTDKKSFIIEKLSRMIHRSQKNKKTINFQKNVRIDIFWPSQSPLQGSQIA